MANGIYHWVLDEMWKDFPNAGSGTSWRLYLVAGNYVADLANHRTFTSPTIEDDDKLFWESVSPTVAGTIVPPHTGIMSLPAVTYTAPSSTTDATAVILTLDDEGSPYTRERMVWYGDDATGLPISFDGADRTVSGITITISNKA